MHWFFRKKALVQWYRCSLSELADEKKLISQSSSTSITLSGNHFTCVFWSYFDIWCLPAGNRGSPFCCFFWKLLILQWLTTGDHPCKSCSHVYKKKAGQNLWTERVRNSNPHSADCRGKKHPHMPLEPRINSMMENSLWGFLNLEQSWHSFFHFWFLGF